MSKRLSKGNTRNAAYASIPRYPLAHFAVVAVAGLFGLASVYGNFLTVETMGLGPIALVLVAALVFTVDMVSVLVAPAFARAKGRSRVTGLGLIVLVMLIGAALQTNALRTAADLTTVDAVQAAQSRVTAVQSKLDALPTSQTVCEGYGPQNCAARQAGLEADRAALVAERDAAKLEAANASQHGLPLTATGLALMGFQIAMFFLRTWLTGVTDRQIEDAKAERAKERAKAKRRKPEPKPKATPERKLKLVAANNN